MTSKTSVYVLDPYHETALSHLRARSDIDVVLPDDSLKADFHANADGILVRSETLLGEGDFKKCARLKVIVKQGVGVDNTDLESAKRNKIVVCNTPGINSESVAELTITLALCIARRVCEIDARIHRGESIIRSETLGHSLFRKTIGIIGMGAIGFVVAQKWLGAMEGTVISFDPYAQPDAWSNVNFKRVHALDELLQQSDVVSLHVPLTAETRGMIGSNQFEQMKAGAILLNCARGGIVDENALLQALKDEKLLGAALDAMEVEPPTLEAYGNGLLQYTNVIITPHKPEWYCRCRDFAGSPGRESGVQPAYIDPLRECS